MEVSSRSRSLVAIIALTVAFVFTLSAFPSAALASHSWNGYHWARTNNPFTLKLGRNLTSTWIPYLSTTSAEWSQSDVIHTTIVTGGTTRSRCNPTGGRVEVCNASYGNTGWLGVAQIWNDGGGHIAQGTVKLNDTYFNTAQYNNTAERNHVMCQEVGHTFGLDHQDTSGASLGTCMDYSNDPSSQAPNQHDYDELDTIYWNHLDGYTSANSVVRVPASVATVNVDAQNQWGKLMSTSHDGHTSTYVRTLSSGFELVTIVFWAK